MRSRKYVLSLLGATAAVSAGAGAAAAATGSKTTTSTTPAAPRTHTERRYAPRSGADPRSHHCPNMGSGSSSSSSQSSGTAAPVAPPSGANI